MSDPARTVIVGDVHGHLDRLLSLLVAARLTHEEGRWTGGKATLVLMGDLFDRGPGGIDALDLVMRLETRAAEHGGRVLTLLGNHDVLILAARHFGERATTGPGGSFLADWKINGGEARDLERMTDTHADWLSRQPAMLHLQNTLLAHADAVLYHRYGENVEEVNAAFSELLLGRDPVAWDRLLDEFSERDAFLGEDGGRQLDHFLSRFGGERLIHGHTPVARVTGQPPGSVTGPHIYAGGRAVNVDHGLYLGGPGFVYELDEGR
ncbi:metallophosphoesterase [Deinococcus sp. YIM 134068]|uniref:metallophosphoesterase n=1 Tax=Deinococcus lichenicola TaxID=3118910 RepID=UPI002F9408E3